MSVPKTEALNEGVKSTVSWKSCSDRSGCRADFSNDAHRSESSDMLHVEKSFYHLHTYLPARVTGMFNSWPAGSLKTVTILVVLQRWDFGFVEQGLFYYFYQISEYFEFQLEMRILNVIHYCIQLIVSANNLTKFNLTTKIIKDKLISGEID